MNVLGTINETSSLAKKLKLPTGYLDAKQDIEAAVSYLYKKNNNQSIIIMGSSYSASLGLIIAAETVEIKAVIAFSPAECLKNTFVAELITDLNKPIYVTSSKKEISSITELMQKVNPKYVTQFEPPIDGEHGARVLWQRITGHEFYWESLKKFLNLIT